LNKSDTAPKAEYKVQCGVQLWLYSNILSSCCDNSGRFSTSEEVSRKSEFSAPSQRHQLSSSIALYL
jgi:hypothetical protein